jgi:hypothetical protein
MCRHMAKQRDCTTPGEAAVSIAFALLRKSLFAALSAQSVHSVTVVGSEERKTGSAVARFR